MIDLTTEPLISFSFLQKAMGSDMLADDSPRTQQAQQEIASASLAIVQYLGRPVLVTEMTEVLDWSQGEYILWLAGAPVLDITDVRLDTAGIFDAESVLEPATATAANDYRVDLSKGRIIFPFRSTYDLVSAVQVTYTAGLVQGRGELEGTDELGIGLSKYHPIAVACAQQAAYQLQRGLNKGGSSEQTGQGFVSYQGESRLLRTVKEILSPWQRNRVY